MADTDDSAGPPPDESVLLGSTGVEAEVLAELARAEAEMNDPQGNADENDDGAVV